MTYIIPNQQTKAHKQDNKSDFSGTIYQSRNISLDEDGYIKLAEATYSPMTEDDDAEFDSADAMFPMDNQIMVNSDYPFSGNVGLNALSNHSGDTNVPSPNVEEDVIFYNEVEVVSDGTSIEYKSGSTAWTSVSMSGFDTSKPTAMCVWESENSLCVGNDNTIKFVNTSWAVNSTVLTIPNDYQVSSMVSNGSQLYIATRNKAAGEAKLYVANAIDTSANSVHGVGTFEIASIKSFKSSVVVLTSLGQLMRFNGGGFIQLGQLPVYDTNYEWCDGNNDYSKVSNRAMVVDGDLVYVNLFSEIEFSQAPILPNFPSGVWCYDDTNQSFYHKYSPTFTKLLLIGNPTVDTTENDFTTGTSLANVITGMPILYTGASSYIPEIKQYKTYYIIKDSSTEFRVAETYTDSLAGTAIDITGVGGSSNKFFIFLVNDYGWTTYGNNIMSLAVLNTQQTSSLYPSRIAMTAQLFAKQDTTEKTVFSAISETLPNRGYFVTPKLNSPSLQEVYNTVAIKYAPLSTDEKIIIKGKSKERKDYPKSSVQLHTTYGKVDYTATWTDTDSFTTTLDLSDAQVGDEIEIIAGVGSGHIAHISSLSDSSGTWTVNLDEAFPFAVADDIFYYNIDNFVKLETITSETALEDDFYQFTFDAKSKFSQFKIEMRGVGITIEEFIVSSKKHLGTRN